MRKIVSRGLYTVMEGMFSSAEFTGNVELSEPLKQDENKSLEGLCIDGHGDEESIPQSSRTAPVFYAELGCRLKFTAWQRMISHRKQRQAALLSETHRSGLI